MAKTRARATSDRDVTFRLGVSVNPETKGEVDKLKRQIKGVHDEIAASGRKSADARTKASKDSAMEQLEQIRKVEKARKETLDKIAGAADRARTASQASATALIQMGRGIAALGVAGEESTEKMVRGLIKVQGAADFLTGTVNSIVEGFRTVKGVSEALRLNRGLARGVGGAVGRAGGSFAGSAASAAAGGAAAQGALSGGRALLGRAGGALANSGRIASIAGRGGLGAIGRFGTGGLAASVGLGAGASVIGAGLGGFQLGRAAKNPAIEAMAFLAEQTGTTAKTLSTLGGPASILFHKFSGIADSADNLVRARQGLRQSEEQLSKLQTDRAERLRREEVNRRESESISRILDQTGSLRDRLTAATRFGGDTRSQTRFLSLQRGRRARDELSADSQLRDFLFSGGLSTKAGREQQKNLLSSARRQELQRSIISSGFDEIGFRRSASADLRRDAERSIADLQSQRQRLSSSGASQQQLQKVDVQIEGRKDFIVKLQADTEEQVRQIVNQIRPLVERQEKLLMESVRKQLSELRQDVTGSFDEQQRIRNAIQ